MVGHKPETYSNNILFNSHKEKWKVRVQGYAVEGAEGGVAKKGSGPVMAVIPLPCCTLVLSGHGSKNPTIDVGGAEVEAEGAKEEKREKFKMEL